MKGCGNAPGPKAKLSPTNIGQHGRLLPWCAPLPGRISRWGDRRRKLPGGGNGRPSCSIQNPFPSFLGPDEGGW